MTAFPPFTVGYSGGAELCLVFDIGGFYSV